MTSLLADVERMRAYDRTIEEQSKKLGCRTGMLWVGVLLGLPLCFLFWPLFLLWLPILIYAIVVSRRWSRTSKLDLENRRYELAGRVLELLERDAEPQAPFHLYLDLRPSDHASKQQRAWKDGSWSYQLFVDEWFWLGGTLADDSSFILRLTEHERVRSGWKKSRSGKLKHKRKSKSKHRLALQLKAKAKKAPHLDGIAAYGHGAVQLPPFCEPKKLRGKGARLRLEAQVKGPWHEPAPGQRPPPHTVRLSTAIAAMFLSLYQMVTLARTKAKGPR